MSGALAPAQAPQLNPADVLADARAAAFNDMQADAGRLVDVLRLCFATEAQANAALGRACFLLVKHCEANEVAGLDAEPWPLAPAELFGGLVARLGDELKCDRRAGPALGWACFRALRDGAAHLATAARLEPRDGHVMRRPGGLRLAPSAFGGERLRAQVLPVAPTPGVPGGDVLRITWEDNGRRVVQSKPGRFAEVDCTAEPE